VQVGVDEQPFWYGGLLHVFHTGRNTFRAQLNVGPRDEAADRTFDEAVKRLSAQGGGLISIYYHPTEFVTTEFWDAVNFSHGANPPRDAWVKPHRRTAEESARCYGVLRHFVEHMKHQDGVRFVTASDLLGMYESPAPAPVSRKSVAARLKDRIVFDNVDGQVMSPAEMVAALLDLNIGTIDGPSAAGATSYSGGSIPVPAFDSGNLTAGNESLRRVLTPYPRQMRFRAPPGPRSRPQLNRRGARGGRDNVFSYRHDCADLPATGMARLIALRWRARVRYANRKHAPSPLRARFG
jgi:hypothetical protein